MDQSLDTLKRQALAAIATANSADELLTIEQDFMGRKSPLAHISQNMANLSGAEKVTLGKELNATKQAISQALTEQQQTILQKDHHLDLSLPAIEVSSGHLHPTSQTAAEIVDIFSHLGLDFVEAPEIDHDWYVFESLNMPKTHPARDDWETFFVDQPADPQLGQVVLRPHTTNFQLHVLQQQKPPVRAMTLGKTYRRQADNTHTPMFHQFEGLVVDKDLSIGNLMATLEHFVHSFFGPEVQTRLRPYHFRFTEPSFEIDITDPTGQMGKDGWLELGGAGMTHPSIIQEAGLDPAEYSGFAWGWGVERCLAIRHHIHDIRMIYDNDIRFLKQF